MKKISMEQFKSEVLKLINGKTTRKKLARELETDIDTINRKITTLSEVDNSLYQEYVKRFPYKPKSRTDIDFEALMIEIMKSGDTVQAASDKYGISVRTISRKVNKIKKENPDLVELYKIYTDTKKRGKKLHIFYEEKISEIPSKPVVLSELTEGREAELEKTLQDFERLVFEEGMSKAEAARRLGFDDYPTVWKKYETLHRIKIEKKTIEETKLQRKKKEEQFRDSIKVSIENRKNRETTNSNDLKEESKEREDI